MRNFDFSSKESFEEALIKNPEIFDMIAFKMLSNDGLPEENKVRIRIIYALMQFRRKMNILWDIAESVEDEDKLNDLYPIRQRILEYIQLINEGADSFLTEHNLPVIE